MLRLRLLLLLPLLCALLILLLLPLKQGGVDVGDHPPITPVRAATEEELGGGATWLLYDYVTRHFLASLSPDCVMKKTKAVLVGGGETFTAHGSVVVKPGFTTIMHWRVSCGVGGWCVGCHRVCVQVSLRCLQASEAPCQQP